jgi:hypothetical protein
MFVRVEPAPLSEIASSGDSTNPCSSVFSHTPTSLAVTEVQILFSGRKARRGNDAPPTPHIGSRISNPSPTNGYED